MSLTKRVERLEAHVRAQNQDEFWVCRQLIYDPRERNIGEEEAIAKMQADELDRLVANGEIRQIDRERVNFIIVHIVHPEPPGDPLSHNEASASPVWRRTTGSETMASSNDPR
jgi:hypothetical protein